MESVNKNNVFICNNIMYTASDRDADLVISILQQILEEISEKSTDVKKILLKLKIDPENQDYDIKCLNEMVDLKLDLSCSSLNTTQLSISLIDNKFEELQCNRILSKFKYDLKTITKAHENSEKEKRQIKNELDKASCEVHRWSYMKSNDQKIIQQIKHIETALASSLMKYPESETKWDFAKIHSEVEHLKQLNGKYNDLLKTKLKYKGFPVNISDAELLIDSLIKEYQSLRSKIYGRK